MSGKNGILLLESPCPSVRPSVMVADMMANMVTDMVDDKVGEKKIALKKKEFLLRAGGRTGSLPSYGRNKL